MSKFAFLQSVRFWKLVIVGVLLSLQQGGYINSELLNAVFGVLELALGGSVIIRTVDRLGEKVGE